VSILGFGVPVAACYHLWVSAKGAAVTKGRGSDGFTLIELMIVVGIVSVLASAAIPVFQRYVRRARNLEGLHNVQKIADSVVAYYGAHSRLPAPTETTSWAFWIETPGAPGPHWSYYCQHLVWPEAAVAEFNQGGDGRVWNALKFQPEGNIRFIYFADVMGAVSPPWVASSFYAYRYEYSACQAKNGYFGMFYEMRLSRSADGLLRAKGPIERRW